MSDFDLIKDLSTLTCVPEQTLRNFCDKEQESICHDVLEAIGNSCNEATIDIGIGEISIIIESDELHYRFVPSSKLETMLIKSIITKQDPLVTTIEDSLFTRLRHTYKDLI